MLQYKSKPLRDPNRRSSTTVEPRDLAQRKRHAQLGSYGGSTFGPCELGEAKRYVPLPSREPSTDWSMRNTAA